MGLTNTLSLLQPQNLPTPGTAAATPSRPVTAGAVIHPMLDTVTVLALASRARDVTPALVGRLAAHPHGIADLRPGGAGHPRSDDRGFQLVLGLLKGALRPLDALHRLHHIHPVHSHALLELSGDTDTERIAMSTTTTPEFDRAVRHAGDTWRTHGSHVPEHGPGRRAVRSALMDARRQGATWHDLAAELRVDATALRDQAGCMPRYGERPAPEHRRQGRGAGHSGCHEHDGCGGHGEGCEGGRRRRERQRTGRG